MKVEYVKANEELTIKISTNFVSRLQNLLLTSKWFKDEIEMAKISAEISASTEPCTTLPAMNVETILMLLSIMEEAAKEQGLMNTAELDDNGEIAQLLNR